MRWEVRERREKVVRRSREKEERQKRKCRGNRCRREQEREKGKCEVKGKRGVKERKEGKEVQRVSQALPMTTTVPVSPGNLVVVVESPVPILQPPKTSPPNQKSKTKTKVAQKPKTKNEEQTHKTNPWRTGGVCVGNVFSGLLPGQRKASPSSNVAPLSSVHQSRPLLPSSNVSPSPEFGHSPKEENTGK